VDDVFDVDSTHNPMLGIALWGEGGGETAMLRHAVAAILNAASDEVDYFYTVAQVKGIVQQAYATRNFEAAKNALAAKNEAGCPFDDDEDDHDDHDDDDDDDD
jgi:succinate dehydrogenase/fumarate reductase flavoprotein subunit